MNITANFVNDKYVHCLLPIWLELLAYYWVKWLWLTKFSMPLKLYQPL